jgi:two-component system cell cycle response regulator DivK
MNLKLYNYILKGIEAEIITSIDGTDALLQIDAHHPKVVILDIQIPKLNGIEVTKQVRANTQYNDITIIAVTAHAMTGDKETILRAGCNYYLAKPIDTRTFRNTISRLLHGEHPQIQSMKGESP